MKFGAGQHVPRLEDQNLITGRGRYADDCRAEGQLYLGLLRANVAHADIVSVDLGAALACDGIVAGATGRDLVAAGIRPIPILREYPGPDGGPMQSPSRHPIAVDRVRHIGEIVAALVGTSQRAVEDAVEHIVVELDDRAAVTDIPSALAPQAPLVHAAAGSNVVTTRCFGDARRVAEIFDSAPHTVALDLINQRIFPSPLEPRSALAIPETGSGRVTLHTGSQNPTNVLKQLSAALGRSADDLRIKVADIGGGFGMKGYLYPEDALVAHFAFQLGKPIKWRGSRLDDFLGATHARDQTSTVAIALDDQLRILALRARTTVNLGAYPAPAGPILALTLGPKVATSVYRIPAIDIQVQGVLTNTQATAPYRGAGRPEAIYAIERLIDHAARTFALDPAEMRRRNLIEPDAMPFRTAIGETYDSGNFPAILQRALTESDWEGFAERRRASDARGLLRGRGLAMFIEWTGGNAFTEDIRIIALADGRLLVETAVIPMGQGIVTTLAQIVADVFEIAPLDVVVRFGDTDVANGFGSFGSRSLFVGGSAVAIGSTEALARFKELAAEALEAAVGDIEYGGGTFRIAGTDHRLTLSQLAARAPDGELSFAYSHTVSGESWPNGAHVCEVEIDPATGMPTLDRYTCVDDVGVVFNPPIVEGQIHGGVAQGIGQALMEHVVHEHETGQLLTATLQDYALPRAIDIPNFTSLLDQSSPCRNNPLGAKGAGESGTIGAPPAVIGAILDALHPLGIDRIDMPATAAQIWAAINRRR